MKSEYRVVVIGGGVVGASVLYHLAKLGWSDIAIVERSVLTVGFELACRRRRPCPQRRPQHRRPPGLHDRPALGDRARVRSGHRDAHDRWDLGGIGSGAVGVAPGDLSDLSDDGHRGRPPDGAGRDQGMVSDHQPRRGPGWTVGRPRGIHRPIGGRSCLCQGRPGTGRRGDRAQPGPRPQPPVRRLLGRGHRAGNDRRRTRCQRGRSLGQAGRPDGGGRASRCLRWPTTTSSPSRSRNWPRSTPRCR